MMKTGNEYCERILPLVAWRGQPRVQPFQGYISPLTSAYPLLCSTRMNPHIKCEEDPRSY